jgi:hypothetical protein
MTVFPTNIRPRWGHFIRSTCRFHTEQLASPTFNCTLWGFSLLVFIDNRERSPVYLWFILGGRSTVGQQTLDLLIGVRIPASQPLLFNQHTTVSRRDRFRRLLNNGRHRRRARSPRLVSSSELQRRAACRGRRLYLQAERRAVPFNAHRAGL